MTDDGNSPIPFELWFPEELKANEQAEIDPFWRFVLRLPEEIKADWRNRPYKSERPDFLIRRKDGTTLGIELARYANQDRMGHQAEKRRERKEDGTTPNPGTIEVGYSRRLTPDKLRASKVFQSKTEKSKSYRENCDQCWLLIHSQSPYAEGPKLPAQFEVDEDAFRESLMESDFDAIWLLDQHGKLVRAG